jgi:hypothetical protein
MTLLQQQNRVQRSAKKQLRINGRMTSFMGPSLTHLSAVWNQASCSDEMGPPVCRGQGSPGGA